MKEEPLVTHVADCVFEGISPASKMMQSCSPLLNGPLVRTRRDRLNQQQRRSICLPQPNILLSRPFTRLVFDGLRSAVRRQLGCQPLEGIREHGDVIKAHVHGIPLVAEQLRLSRVDRRTPGAACSVRTSLLVEATGVRPGQQIQSACLDHLPVHLEYHGGVGCVVYQQLSAVPAR